MLSLTTFFWIMVFLFALVGMMRGWTREIVVTSALILALFTINQFLFPLFGFIGWDNNAPQITTEVQRWQFYMMTALLVTIAFFGYQGPTLARSRIGEKLSRRDNLQDRLLGFLVGGTNGWLTAGTIWGFLEYKLIGASNWARFTPDIPYPFDPARIVRPAPELAPIIENLPIPLLTSSPYFLPVLLVFVFLFVLVVLL